MVNLKKGKEIRRGPRQLLRSRRGVKKVNRKIWWFRVNLQATGESSEPNHRF